MKVTVDSEDCEAQGKCEKICPGVFKLGDDDVLSILLDDLPEEFQDAVKEAVKRCPKQALRLA